MILRIKNKKISSITIGNAIPSNGEICFPDNLSMDDIKKKLKPTKKSNKKQSKIRNYIINEEDPEDPIYLTEI